MDLRLPPELEALSPSAIVAALCRIDPGVWAQEKRGFCNAPVHDEWYALLQKHARLCVVAPREHAKTEVFTVNATAWRSIYHPGTWTYLFAQTKEQAQEMKERIDSAVEHSNPELINGMKVQTKTESRYTNGSRVTAAGAGKAVRGAHPDVIIGDDLLEEDAARSQTQRTHIERWWFGTVANMAHPGTSRRLPTGRIVTMPATRVVLVGTPFHQKDLLLMMKDNPLYHFRRYAAEYRQSDLVDGLAVEVG